MREFVDNVTADKRQTGCIRENKVTVVERRAVLYQKGESCVCKKWKELNSLELVHMSHNRLGKLVKGKSGGLEQRARMDSFYMYIMFLCRN